MGNTCEEKTKKNDNSPSTEQVLSALAIYETDFQHRDNFMTKEGYTLFFAGLVCNIIPFLLNNYDIDLPPMLHLIFPLIAVCITVYFWFYMISCAARLYAASQTIENMVKLLPKEMQRVSIKDTPFAVSRFAIAPMSLWTPAVMSVALFAVDAAIFLFLIYDYSSEFCGILMCAIWVLLVAIWTAIIFFMKRRYKEKEDS